VTILNNNYYLQFLWKFCVIYDDKKGLNFFVDIKLA